MSDKSYLDWPFFDDTRRALECDLEAWASKHIAHTGHGVDTDAACRGLVRDLGRAGWLKYCVPAAHGGAREQIDSRSLRIYEGATEVQKLIIARETLK